MKPHDGTDLRLLLTWAQLEPAQIMYIHIGLHGE